MSLTSISSPQNVSGAYAPDLSKSSTPAVSTPAATTVPSDQASLSTAGGLIAQAISGSNSDVRTDKVAALQQAIANGTYHVASSDVAGKIVDSLLG
jgi:negative regulator of flagellin synthesis FlgM